MHNKKDPERSINAAKTQDPCFSTPLNKKPTK